MIILMFLFATNISPFQMTESKLLDTKGQFIPYLVAQSVRQNIDGSFIVTGEWAVWHFSASGGFINHFGGKGEGPNEFQYVREALWDGKCYWVLDGVALCIKQFDGKGKFIKKHAIWFNHMRQAGDNYYVANIDGLKDKRKKNPLFLSKVNPYENFKAGPLFHKFSEAQISMAYNFQEHFLAKLGDNIYVLNQFDNVLAEYLITGGSKTKAIQFQTPGFVPLPAKKQNYTGDLKKWLSYSHSFSKFTGLDATQSGFVVAYETPADDNETVPGALLNVTLQEKDQRPKKILQRFKGYYIGWYNNRLRALTEDEDSKNPSYHLKEFQ